MSVLLKISQIIFKDTFDQQMQQEYLKSNNFKTKFGKQPQQANHYRQCKPENDCKPVLVELSPDITAECQIKSFRPKKQKKESLSDQIPEQLISNLL